MPRKFWVLDTQLTNFLFSYIILSPIEFSLLMD